MDIEKAKRPVRFFSISLSRLFFFIPGNSGIYQILDIDKYRWSTETRYKEAKARACKRGGGKESNEKESFWGLVFIWPSVEMLCSLVIDSIDRFRYLPLVAAFNHDRLEINVIVLSE